MSSILDSSLSFITRSIAESEFRQVVLELLMGVPGLPPILQALHILGIVLIIAAVVHPALRVLGLSAQQQEYPEMLDRLRPWMLGALALLFVTGIVFVIARPGRYLFNPIFGIKFFCLLTALVLSLVLQRRARVSAAGFTLLQKSLAGLSLVAWLGVIFAGRWIAYVDYLFWEE